jgi:hypothetical protein
MLKSMHAASEHIHVLALSIKLLHVGAIIEEYDGRSRGDSHRFSNGLHTRTRTARQCRVSTTQHAHARTHTNLTFACIHLQNVNIVPLFRELMSKCRNVSALARRIKEEDHYLRTHAATYRNKKRQAGKAL